MVLHVAVVLNDLEECGLFEADEKSVVARIDRQSHTFEWGDGPMQYIVREG